MQTKASLCIVKCTRFTNCGFTPAETRSSKGFTGNGKNSLVLSPPPAFGTAIAADDDNAAGAAAAPDKESEKGTQPASRADADDLAAREKETPGAVADEGRGAGTTVPPSLASFSCVQML